MVSDHHIREIVAGTVGGWAQVVVGHPFDTVKVSAHILHHHFFDNLFIGKLTHQMLFSNI
jgi:hypothetical protein